MPATPCPWRPILGIVAIRLARRARRRLERTVGRAGGAVPARLGRILGWLGLYLALIGAIALALLLRRLPRLVVDSVPGVRDRQQPPRGSSPAGARLLRDRAVDEDPRQVPARPGGRAVRSPARADVRQGLPSLVRGPPRPGRAALRRRVQLALRARRARGRGGAAPAQAACRTAGPRRRVPEQGGLDHARRDRRPHRVRLRRLDFGRARQPEHGALGHHDAEEEGAAEADGQARRLGRQGRRVRRRLPRAAHREADLRGHARERAAATGSSAAISGSTCSRPRT